MQRFKSLSLAWDFLTARGIIYGHVQPRRHRMTAACYRRVRTKKLRIWQQETCVHHHDSCDYPIPPSPIQIRSYCVKLAMPPPIIRWLLLSIR